MGREYLQIGSHKPIVRIVDSCASRFIGGIAFNMTVRPRPSHCESPPGSHGCCDWPKIQGLLGERNFCPFNVIPSTKVRFGP